MRMDEIAAHNQVRWKAFAEAGALFALTLYPVTAFMKQ